MAKPATQTDTAKATRARVKTNPKRALASEAASDSGMPAVIPARLKDDPRVRVVSHGDGRDGAYVVYWAQMFRRAESNAALSFAIALANERKLPLLVYEALRPDYPYASDRFHAFVLEGARVEQSRFLARGAGYAFFLPRSTDEARGVLAKLCERADVLITDDFPTFIIPAQIAALAKHARCEVIAFDDNAVVPMSLLAKDEYAARTIRPKMHRLLETWLRPIEEPECHVPWKDIDLPFDRFDLASLSLEHTLKTLPIDHAVARVSATPGGSIEATARLDRFVAKKLLHYADEHNHPDAAVTSSLSPYLHFGMISPRTIALKVLDAKSSAAKHALDTQADAFLEQLLVRRGLAYNYAWNNAGHRTYEAIPEWCKKTLEAHVRDPRERLYTREELEEARSYDPIWNAAQREIAQTGVIQNYLRMVWGKGVMAWTSTPKEAFDELVHLNDRYGLDGRNPNTYASIAWCFGKHDRPWGPERKIFGNIRYMSSALTPKKIHMKGYLGRFGVR